MTRRAALSDKAYDALIEQARAALRGRDLGRAEQRAREGLAHDPERAAAYNLLAAVRELQGHQPQAMNLLRAGIAVDATYQPAQTNLARLGSHPHRLPIALGDETG